MTVIDMPPRQRTDPPAAVLRLLLRMIGAALEQKLAAMEFLLSLVKAGHALPMLEISATVHRLRAASRGTEAILNKHMPAPESAADEAAARAALRSSIVKLLAWDAAANTGVELLVQNYLGWRA